MAISDKSGGNLGSLEAAIMDVVWDREEAVTGRAVVDALNSYRSEPLAYTTVMTVMGRLTEKEVLRRRKEGRVFLYEATASDAAGLAVKEVLGTYGDAAVAHFLDEARADPDVMERLRAILIDADG
jgi:predicted transcriptional regulator